MNRQEKRIWYRSSNKLVFSHAFSCFKKYWQIFLPVTVLLILLYAIPLPIVEYDMQKAILFLLVILEISILIQFSAYSRKLAIWKNYLHKSNNIDHLPDQLKDNVSDDEQVFLLTHLTLQHLRAKNQLDLDHTMKVKILTNLLPKEDLIKFVKLEKENAHPAMKMLGILLVILGVPATVLFLLFLIVQMTSNYSDFLFVAKGITFVGPPLVILLLISTILGLKTHDSNVIWMQFLTQNQFEDSKRLFQGYLTYSENKDMDEIIQFQVLEYAQKYIQMAYNSTDFDILV